MLNAMSAMLEHCGLFFTPAEVDLWQPVFEAYVDRLVTLRSISADGLEPATVFRATWSLEGEAQ